MDHSGASARAAADAKATAVVLFGPPGSGKGTQAKLLRDQLGIPHISTGDMLRQHIEAGDDVGRAIEAMMRSGGLVPDDMVNGLVRERLAAGDCQGGFILDGYPRTEPQARTLAEWLDSRLVGQVVIHLLVDYNVIIARLTGRRQCASCGALYNLVSQPPSREGVCDRDGGPLILRADDSEDVIRQRLEAYEKQTRPVLNYFRRAGHAVVEIDATVASPDDVSVEVGRAVMAV
ncbi:MAG: adenylate kinase [Bryobacterales bacterium]|nr:adenylate kinase [Bryobacterales bacterium]